MRSFERMPSASSGDLSDEFSSLGLNINGNHSSHSSNGESAAQPQRTSPYPRFIDEMMKRGNSQSFEGSPSLLAGAPAGLDMTHVAAGMAPMADGNSKKARFVSEGNIPHYAYAPPGQQQQQQLHDISPSMNAAGIYGSVVSGMPSHIAPQDGAQGGFTGHMMMSQGNGRAASNGVPAQVASPYATQQQHQQSNGNSGSAQQQLPPNMYASAPLNVPLGHGSMINAQFSPINANGQAAPYMLPQAGDQQHLASPMNAMYASFTPGTFTPSAGGMPFIPNLGLLSAPGTGNTTGRTVYLGNLPADASVDELLNQIKFGPIENVRILPEKNCAFISFLDGVTAAAFHADAMVKKMSLLNQDLKVGWGKPSPVPSPIVMAVQQHQATRNVYLGQLNETHTEQSLRDDLARFGLIDQVKIVRDQNIGFVHFLSISTAMKVVATLPQEPAWAGKRVNYGKDRCAYVPRSQQQNQAHNNQAAAMGMAAAASLGYPAFTAAGGGFAMPNFGMGLHQGGVPSPLNYQFAHAGNGHHLANGNIDDAIRGPASGFGQGGAASLGLGSAPSALHQMGNRTVYLGNIHPDTTTEEICNHIRGGILQSIRYMPEKHIAFVTFVDTNTALAFYHLASYTGIMVHQRRLKIGWGKNPGPLSPAIAMAVQAGGSRNVYIGNIEDPEQLTAEKIRQDFGEYGEIELVNTLKEKNCAFVNFCNIQKAIKAIEAMKNHPDYQSVRIAYGKDRCGNLPRNVSSSLNATRKSSGSLSPNPHNEADEAAGQAAITAAAAASAAAAAAQAAGGTQPPEVSAAIGLSAVASGAVAAGSD